jgi:hypothetical protein
VQQRHTYSSLESSLFLQSVLPWSALSWIGEHLV